MCINSNMRLLETGVSSVNNMADNVWFFSKYVGIKVHSCSTECD